MVFDADISIIGAGVVGLACAAALAESGRDLFVIEQYDGFGRETSSRNSEVIHAGIYYVPGSMKARFCVEGRDKLYSFCEKYGVPYKRITKFITATNPAEVPRLRALMQHANSMGAGKLQWLDGPEAREWEPELRCEAAVFSPNTGILDSHVLMETLERQAEEKDAIIQYHSRLKAIRKLDGGGFELTIDQPSGEEVFTSRVLINSAGLHAQDIARMAGIDTQKADYGIHLCKGEYFAVNNHKLSANIGRLIYPLPCADSRSLGIHTRFDLTGRLSFGPSAEWVDEIDYTVNPDHLDLFYESGVKFLPALERDDLTPDMAGIRPKLQAPGEPQRDFIIREESDKGLPGLINLIGIDSPGLTACLSIADHVDSMVSLLT
ncbi:MAG: NAD(P)/FAD-dependent oxidoreductase [Candidatus Sumerlaeota bacterium]